jgi:predicted Zn-ribbon and HTH transcriptional regulator
VVFLCVNIYLSLYYIYAYTIKRSNNLKCQICGYEGLGKDFSNHLRKEHGLKSKEYTKKYIYCNRVGCKNCGKETRYTSFKFKKYCKDCVKIAMKEGGKKGGKAEAWNKGKTYKDDKRIVRLKGKDNPFWGKKHNQEALNKMSLTKRLGGKEVLERILKRNKEFEILTPIEEYFSRQRQYLDFKCKKCGFECKKTLQAFERGSLCPKCYPITRSQAEVEIYEYISSLEIKHVLTNDRNIIKPKEIDVLIKQHHFGIEFNGLYWHSEVIDRTTKYDLLNKTKQCQENGIKLMHIFSDEWEYKKEICKSMIKNRLGLCNRVFARKCVIKEIDKKEFDEFMNKSHISGSVNSSIRLGLFYKEELISAIGFRKPRQKKWKGYYEISRFATKIDTVVTGGLSKFLSYFKKTKEEKLMTYADRRFGEGLGYEKVGFKYCGDTGIDYWYTDGKCRYDRFIIKTDNDMSEKEKAYEMGLYKVWGCGSNIWVLEDN